jgi:uncharacterized OB-fold protein
MEIARHWRLNAQRYSLRGSVCTCCGKAFFAPRPVCDACRQQDNDANRIESEQGRTSELDAAYIAQR